MELTLQQQINKLQKSLYAKAYKEALKASGTSRSILEYSKDYEKTLPSKYKVINNSELLDSLKSKQLILFGDFHALRQSQRGFLRLIRDFVFKLDEKSLVIALEMFRSEDQEFIDEYMKGDLSDEQFLKKINYAREWGFFWPNFKVILEFAKEFKFPVIGLNSEAAGRDTLKERDQHAAKILDNVLKKYPHATVFTMIGEYHLADAHLLDALKDLGVDIDNVARVLSNIDRYYFQLHNRSHNAASTEYLKLKKDLFCIVNTPPWIKWQSYALWEEMRSGNDNDSELEDEENYSDSRFDGYTEYTFDADYHFLGIVKSLASFLGLSLGTKELTAFRVFVSAEADFFKILKSEHIFTNKEISQIVDRAMIDGHYFVSRCRTALISDLTLNNMASAAGQYLHHILTNDLDIGQNPIESFYRNVVKSMVGMVASKILNPRRKSAELNHFYHLLEQNRGEKVTGKQKKKLLIAKAVLKHHTWINEKINEKETPSESSDEVDVSFDLPKTIRNAEKSSSGEVSFAIGQMLGYHLYVAVVAGRASASNVHSLFHETLKDFREVWDFVKDTYRFIPKK